MPVTPDHPAPYAPSTAILGLIERHRNKGLPSPVDADVLGRAGISGSLIPRTLHALQALDLLDVDGKPTSILEGLRLAPEAEYNKRLRDWLATAYADALQFVDPAVDDEVAIRDAFRNYKPVGQQPRMVTLFIGLFRAAGMAPGKSAAGPRLKIATPTPKPRAVSKAISEVPIRPQSHTSTLSSGLPPPIAGLLASLPDPNIGWTKADRDRFMATFGAVLDFCFPPAEAARRKHKAAEDEDAAA